MSWTEEKRIQAAPNPYRGGQGNVANLFLQTVFFPRLCPANSVLVPVSWGAQFCWDGVSVFSGHVYPVCIEQLTTLLNIY